MTDIADGARPKSTDDDNGQLSSDIPAFSTATPSTIYKDHESNKKDPDDTLELSESQDTDRKESPVPDTTTQSHPTSIAPPSPPAMGEQGGWAPFQNCGCTEH